MGALGHALRGHVGLTIRETRRAIGWSQVELGRRAAISQSEISKIERAEVDDLSFETAAGLLETLGVGVVLELRRPYLSSGGRQRDAAHARCVAYVARRLRRAGWEVRTEVEVLAGTARGWIDILAFRASDGVLLVIEVKTQIDDIGALQRQVGWYERRAWSAARSVEWRPSAVVTLVVVLATADNAEKLGANRLLLAPEFGLTAAALRQLVDGGMAPGRNRRRAIAMIDPYDRSRAWVSRSPVEGRARPARYSNLSDFLSFRTRRRPDIRRATRNGGIAA